jgi:serine/threonine protein kinase
MPKARKSKAPGLSIRTSGDAGRAAQPMNRSYSLSKSGVFQSDKGFAINKHGIQQSPAASGNGGRRREFMVESLDELQIMEVVGHGAGGVVNKAVHKPTDTLVAVKSIDVLDDDKRHQLMRELRTLYDSTGEHIVQFYGAFYDDCHVYVVLEFMDAGSLADVHRRAGRLPESVASDFTTQLVAGLHYLHRTKYQVHRDIKPANMLCDRSGRVRLSDFGIAADVGHTMGQCETFLGTARYMAPETLAGQPYSFPADVWSLGICLYEFAVGRYPYASFSSHWELLDAMQARPPPSLPAEGEEDCGGFSAEFRDFVGRCLQMEPEARADVQELSQGRVRPPPPPLCAPPAGEVVPARRGRGLAVLRPCPHVCCHGAAVHSTHSSMAP